MDQKKMVCVITGASGGIGKEVVSTFCGLGYHVAMLDRDGELLEKTMQEHPEVLLAAIGPVTAKTLEGHGLKPGLVPDNFSIPHLVEALTVHYSKE